MPYTAAPFLRLPVNWGYERVIRRQSSAHYFHILDIDDLFQRRLALDRLFDT